MLHLWGAPARLTTALKLLHRVVIQFRGCRQTVTYLKTPQRSPRWFIEHPADFAEIELLILQRLLHSYD